MNMFITRHGKTDWNAQGKVQGHADIELNDEGIKQALITRELLKNETIDLILCSPLLRARQTAEIIKGDRDIKIINDKGLLERDFGEFEGLRKDEFDFEGFWNYKEPIKYEKAENINEFYQRVFNALRRIRKQYKKYENILLVTHGGVSIPVDCFFTGIIYKDNMLDSALENCEVKKYEYR